MATISITNSTGTGTATFTVTGAIVQPPVNGYCFEITFTQPAGGGALTNATYGITNDVMLIYTGSQTVSDGVTTYKPNIIAKDGFQGFEKLIDVVKQPGEYSTYASAKLSLYGFDGDLFTYIKTNYALRGMKFVCRSIVFGTFQTEFTGIVDELYESENTIEISAFDGGQEWHNEFANQALLDATYPVSVGNIPYAVGVLGADEEEIFRLSTYQDNYTIWSKASTYLVINSTVLSSEKLGQLNGKFINISGVGSFEVSTAVNQIIYDGSYSWYMLKVNLANAISTEALEKIELFNSSFVEGESPLPSSVQFSNKYQTYYVSENEVYSVTSNGSTPSTILSNGYMFDFQRFDVDGSPLMIDESFRFASVRANKFEYGDPLYIKSLTYLATDLNDLVLQNNPIDTTLFTSTIWGTTGAPFSIEIKGYIQVIVRDGDENAIFDNDFDFGSSISYTSGSGWLLASTVLDGGFEISGRGMPWDGNIPRPTLYEEDSLIVQDVENYLKAGLNTYWLPFTTTLTISGNGIATLDITALSTSTIKAYVDFNDSGVNLEGEIYDNVPARAGWTSTDYPFHPAYVAEYIMRLADGLTDAEIDIASFNSAAGVNPNVDWNGVTIIGYQVFNPTNSYDVVNEICRNTGLAIFPGNDGKRNCKRWMGASFGDFAIAEEHIISGSIKAKETPLRYLYNDFSISYGYDFKGKVFTKIARIGVTATGAKDVSGWITYSNEADDLADICLSAYQTSGVVQPFKLQENKFIHTEGQAIAYLRDVIYAMAKIRPLIDFKVPISLFQGIELLDSGTFTDQVFAPSGINCWIMRKEIDPADDTYSVQIIGEGDTVSFSTFYLLTEASEFLTTESGDSLLW